MGREQRCCLAKICPALSYRNTMKKVAKIKPINIHKGTADKPHVNSGRVKERHITGIPDLRAKLRGMLAGTDIATRYNEPQPEVPDKIEIKQVVVRRHPCLSNVEF